MTTASPPSPRVLVLAPVGFDLVELKGLLEAAGLTLMTLGETASSDTSAIAALRRTFASAGLVLVLSDGVPSPSQLFEAGFAAGQNRPVLIAAPTLSDLVVPGAHVLTYEAWNPHRIVETARRMVKAPVAISPRKESPTFPDRSAARANTAREFETKVADAIRASGVDLSNRNSSDDDGFDLAVYSADLELVVGNPLLVEIKRELPPNPKPLILQLAGAAQAIRVPWVLLIHGSATNTPIPQNLPFNVLVMPFELLGEKPSPGQFVRVVQSLRNSAAHGLPR